LVLEKIIRLTARQSGTDMTKLARWLRCLFNLALTSGEHVSFLCTEQAVTLATAHHKVSPLSVSPNQPRAILKPRQGISVAMPTPPPFSDPIKHDDDISADDSCKTADRYPPTELEWLATSAFNHGVDYYLQENDEGCKKWAHQAFILAQWLEDGGALRDLLMEKYASLKLQV
jgi:hypothetical protein